MSESVSGTKSFEKRILGRMIRKMGKGDMLICTEISRLGRNMLMIMSILNICSSKGISIHSIKDNFDLSDNINSQIIAFAFALAAEIERILISERTREALALKRQSGVRLGRPPGSSRKKVTVYNEWDKIIEEAISEGDSVGGIVECRCSNVPAGLGEPFFDSLESQLSHLLFSIPVPRYYIR